MDYNYSIDLEYKILLLGDICSGKVNLLDRYIDNSFEQNQSSTIGIDIRYKYIIKDNKKIKLDFWDTAGQERFKGLRKNYFKGSNGIILVCDITNRETLTRLKNNIEDVKKSFLEGKVEIIIIANKIDLVDQRKISENELNKFGEKNNIEVFYTSAKTGEGVEEAFNSLINKIINNKYFGIEKVRDNDDDEEFNDKKKSFRLIKSYNNKNINKKKNNC